MKEKTILEVAEKRGVTPASVLLSYHGMRSPAIPFHQRS